MPHVIFALVLQYSVTTPVVVGYFDRLDQCQQQADKYAAIRPMFAMGICFAVNYPLFPGQR